MNQKLYDRAIRAIEEHKILLAYPLKAKSKVLSLWEVLFPRTQMNWDWSEEGDSKVAQVWRLRESLAQGGEVVYSKWFKNRATLFSKDSFEHYLNFVSSYNLEETVSRTAAEIYESLLENSPQSTKELKLSTGLKGKLFASAFDKGCRELFLKGLIVGVGEVDDGAFPSLNIAATKLHFEDLWNKSQKPRATHNLDWPEIATLQAYSIKKQAHLIG